MPAAPTSLTLGERQLAIYLSQQGIDPKAIPTAAMKEIIEMACESMELTSLRDSQAMVRYMGLLKAYSKVITDYCTKFGQTRNAEEQAICDILSDHGVLAATE